MPNILVSPNNVKAVFSETDVNSSGGLDGVHPRFLKEMATLLAEPLASLYNDSLQNGVLPEEWLKSIVVPIFKKGSRLDPSNYRAVSLTSPVCRSLERIIVE